MQLSIPCNWDPDLLNGLASVVEIDEMIGALDVTPVGGGRPSSIFKAISKGDAAEYVKEVHRNGWKFNSLLNAPCMGNMEFDVKTHRQLLAHLEWLCEIGVNSVTVSIPYLIELIKKQFPSLYVKGSVIANIDTTQRAQYFRELGVDGITVDFMKNRDFKFLTKLKEAVDCDLILLANDSCLYQCPYRLYHYNACGHASQKGDPLNGYYMDYSVVRCSIDKLSKPETTLMARWIRPEDLITYEDMGYYRFKLSGREMPTERIVQVVKAYANRKFNGNLMEILNPYIPKGDLRMPRIDNRKLEGFLDYFKNFDCTDNCYSCDYCKNMARQVVSVDSHAAAEHQKSLERFNNGLAASGFVPQKK